MNTEQIKEELTFNRKYIRKLAAVDEMTAQRLTARNKPKRDIIIDVLKLDCSKRNSVRLEPTKEASETLSRAQW